MSEDSMETWVTLEEYERVFAQMRDLRGLMERLVATTDLRAAPESIKREIAEVIRG